MKAEIDNFNRLVLVPESTTEKYAIDLWVSHNAVPYPTNSIERCINKYTQCILVSSILVDSRSLS